MYGNWINNGTYMFGTGSLTFKKAGGTQTISGTGTTFNNLIVSNTNPMVQIGMDISLNATGTLTLTGGVLDLNSHKLTINNTATTGISSTNGYILSETNAAVNPSKVKWATGGLIGTYVFPFGVAGSKIPFTFDKTAGTGDVTVSTRATAGSDNTPWPGASSVAAVTNMYDYPLGGDGSIGAVVDRWWDIDVGGAVINANLTFSYRGVENTLNALYSTGTLSAQHWDGTQWNVPVGSGAGVTTGVGTVTVANESSFSPWTLVANSVPLPIQLLTFDAVYNGHTVDLDWKTATEINNDFFTVERTRNNQDFDFISHVLGGGNSNLMRSYHSIDNDPLIGLSYYRLSQTDFDGTTVRTGLVPVMIGAGTIDIINVYNNYDENSINVILNDKVKESLEVSLYDILGKQIASHNLETRDGLNVISFDASSLSKGVYMVSVVGGRKTYNKKIVY